MKKTMVIAAIGLAVGAFILDWLEYQYAVRAFSTEIYIILIAVFFSIVGIWAGGRLSRHTPKAAFERNQQAIQYLGISAREEEVLTRLGEGMSNKEIARALGVSPNTIKTHLAKLYDKLDVVRRTQAVSKAKDLRLIP